MSQGGGGVIANLITSAVLLAALLVCAATMLGDVSVTGPEHYQRAEELLGGVDDLAIDCCGTASREQKTLLAKMRIAREIVEQFAVALDGEHLTLTTAAQHLEAGEPLL